MQIEPARGYVEVPGVRTHVLERGAGAPLLLLHGGLETVDMLPALTTALASRFHVIAPERRGHGRTPDVLGPITYEAMAADTLGVMDALSIEHAHIVGYSDGANVAMLLAMSHPERVGRLVLVSGNFDAEGMTSAFRVALRRATAETYAPALAEAYRRLSPDGPDHWPVVFEKVRRMWQEEPRLTPRDLARITAPALVLAGDDDVVRVGHTAALAGSIPGSRLRFLRGGTHGLLTEHPAEAARLILEFMEERADGSARAEG